MNNNNFKEITLSIDEVKKMFNIENITLDEIEKIFKINTNEIENITTFNNTNEINDNITSKNNNTNDDIEDDQIIDSNIIDLFNKYIIDNLKDIKPDLSDFFNNFKCINITNNINIDNFI